MTRSPDQQLPEWASPATLREYYADYLFCNDGEDPQHEIYQAVISGAIRVRHQGRIWTKEEVAALGEKRLSKDDEHALPADIGLSIDDALRHWADRPGATAMIRVHPRKG